METALDLLERAHPAGRLTVRTVASRAGMSERTVFRYFRTRAAFWNAVAVGVSARLELPPHPSSVELLLATPSALFRRYEAKANLTRAALGPEIFSRLRETQARERGLAVRAVLDATAPQAPERSRKLAAASMRYLLSASTWHYFRDYLGLTLDETIESAEMAVGCLLRDLLAEVHASDVPGR